MKCSKEIKTDSSGNDIWVDYKWMTNNHWSKYSFQEPWLGQWCREKQILKMTTHISEREDKNTIEACKPAK